MLIKDLRWNERRCKELVLLKKLFEVAGSLNKGNNVSQKILECEEMVDALKYGEGVSFQEFLTEMAIEERSKEKVCTTCDGLGGIGIVGSATRPAIICPTCGGRGVVR